MNETDIYQYAMDRLAAGADAERVIQELSDADIDVVRVRDIVGAASGDLIRRNYYEVLEVSSTASLSDIKIAYRQKALQYHPDRNINPGAAERFKQINSTYNILSDYRKRAAYDSSLCNTSGGFRKTRQGTRGSNVRSADDPWRRGPRSAPIDDSVRQLVWNRLLEGQDPDNIVDELVYLGINEPAAKNLVFVTQGRIRQDYGRQSQHASTERHGQSTVESAETEESWCDIFANVAMKIAGWTVGAALGYGIVWLLLRLRPWEWWN